jgi:gamma-glutamylcyclotransferase (GGCT)/AIG2-like uncharacterized protein YtfP
MWSRRWPAGIETAMRSPWFFFYGTLSEDCDNPITRAILPLMRGGRRGSVRGSLRGVRTALGWYPVLANGFGRVRGRLYRAGPRFAARHLRALDAYEALDPQRLVKSEYRRRVVRVRIYGGGFVMAQAYCHNRPAHAGLPVIPGGDFALFLSRRRLRAFAAL